jgi:soluble lytic murein transglycosylase
VHKGRVGFLVFFLSLCSCPAQQSASDFYEGLKKRHNGAQTEAIACFEKALDSANTAIAAAAAAELMSMHFAGAELSDAAMIVIRQKAAGSWERAFDSEENPLAMLLDGESRSLDEAARYVLQKLRGSDNSLSEAENEVIDGRFAASRSRYNEAMLFFRIALDDSPELFFRYPDLIVDLGRAFQYSAARKEGMDLFLRWEQIMSGEENAEGQGKELRDCVPVGSENLVRFRLLFFAARMSRQSGDHRVELFERAIPFARTVSPEQTDACIWYILDTSLTQGAGKAFRYLETYIPQWHDDAYFSDVMDKFAREFVRTSQWEPMHKVFLLLRDRSGAATAQYAWILGRAIEEGLFSSDEYARVYMRIAYDAAGSGLSNGASIGNSAWYYRSISAAALGGPFLALPEKEKAAEPDEHSSDVMSFLLGFFAHDAAQFAPRYIRAEERDLSPADLYLLANALGAAGQYQESMRLISLYTRRSGYQITRQDMELLFPRPFRELVEQYAAETGIEPSLLYALIRTESAFNSDVVSRAGAVGLTQLMPATAEETAVRIRRRGGPDYLRAVTAEDPEESPSIDLKDPAVNIHIGAAYLAYLNERMEDPLLALIAYNGGVSRIRRWYRTSSLPSDLFLETVEYSETRNYGRSVMGAAALYKELYGSP